MLFYDFKNYEEFKEIFAIVEHGNGNKSRRNGILLSLYKDRNALRRFIRYKEFLSCREMESHFYWKARHANRSDGKNARVHLPRYMMLNAFYANAAAAFSSDEAAYCLLSCRFLPELKSIILDRMGFPSLFCGTGASHELYLAGRVYLSDAYVTDDMKGLCEDGTLNAIRYRNIEKDRMFKMKAGRMFNHLMSCNLITRDLPVQIQRWLSEQFVNDWISYAEQNIGDSSEYELHVDDNFGKIYDKDCCAGYDEDDDSFGSCMVDDDQYDFYRDSVEAKAAYLTDEDDMVVARCILFTDVTDEDGNKWRLAERQYAANCDDDLKRKLVCALIKGGHIDGYKRTTASCHEARDFVDLEGNSLSGKRFSIRCTLGPDDTLSYQDSFKYYKVKEQRAYNYDSVGYDFDLAITDDYIGGQYCDHRDERYFDMFTRYCKNTETYEHVDDCIEIDCCYYYAGLDCEEPDLYDVHKCDNCGSWFYRGYYSEVTEKNYCCYDCKEEGEVQYKAENWYWSDFDLDYFEDEDDVVHAYMYNGYYKEITISVESFNRCVSNGEATEFMGELFLDDVNLEGEPVHYGLFKKSA